MRRVLRCVLLLLGGLVNVAIAQVPGEIDLRLQHLGVEQGLSQSTARALAQDGDGMVWIGTQDGLNRYDGYTFRVFRHDASDTTSLPDNHVTALATDKAGRLWVGTQSGGLGRYDPDRQAFHNFPVALNRSDALAVVCGWPVGMTICNALIPRMIDSQRLHCLRSRKLDRCWGCLMAMY